MLFREPLPSELSSLRALHDACLEVRYEDAFFTSLLSGRQDLVCLVAASEACTAAAPSADSAAASTDTAAAAQPALLGVVSARLAKEDARWSAWAQVLQAARAVLGFFSPGAAAAAAEGSSSSSSSSFCKAYIMTLCVSPDMRRQGVARGLLLALLHELSCGKSSRALSSSSSREAGGSSHATEPTTIHFEEEAAAAAAAAAATTEEPATPLPPPSAPALELHVLTTNGAALSLYESLGFSRRSVIRDYYTFHGATHDAVHMRREAGPPQGPEPAAGSAAQSQQEEGEEEGAGSSAAAAAAGVSAWLWRSLGFSPS